MKGAGLLEEGRVRLLLSLRHTGFSVHVHKQVTVPPGDGRAIEALARYGLRTPVGLTSLCLTADSSTVEYLAGGHDDAPGETLDALESLARVLAYIPDPKRHLVRYYGAYSNLVRGKHKQKARAALAQAPTAMPAPPPIRRKARRLP